MNGDLSLWDAIADEWVGKIDKKREFKPLLITQGLNELLAGVSGKKVLDAGCGDGIYTGYILKLGNHPIGIDGSANMLAIAKRNFPSIDFRLADLLAPLGFKDSEFDIVVSNMVLMSLKNIQPFLSESHRILKPSGRLLISVQHPAFGQHTTRLYKNLVDKILFRVPKGLTENYYRASDTRVWENDKSKKLPFYHRTFEEYSKELNKSGFAIESLAEPHALPAEFLKKFPKYEYVTRLPRFLFIKAVKLA